MRPRSTLLCLSLPFLATAALADDCSSSETTHAYQSAGPVPDSASKGDVDGDGLLDVVVCNPTSNQVHVLLGNGDGTFAAPVGYAAGTAPYTTDLGDVDGDGDLDIVVADYGVYGSSWQKFGVSVLRNDGTGVFGAPTFYAVPAPSAEVTAAKLGDLDGDGDLDIAASIAYSGSSGYGQIGTFLNDGAGNYTGPALVTAWGDPIDLELGDMDHDGDLDAVTVAYQYTKCTVWMGNGDGTFDPNVHQYYSTKWPYSVLLGDTNGDGWLDAVIGSHYGLRILKNAGDGTFATLGSLDAGLRPTDAVLYDAEGDGDMDLAVTDTLGDRLYLFANSGTGAYTLVDNPLVGNGPRSVVAANFDRLDTLPDLAVVEANDQRLHTILTTCLLGTYCQAKTNSQGCVPTIGSTGSPSLTGPDDFYVTATDVLNNKAGVLFFGFGPYDLPLYGGTLCVQPALIRTDAQVSGGNPPPDDCSGTYSFHFSQAFMAQKQLTAGTRVFGQYWMRDPKHTDGTKVGLTGGIHFTILP